MIKDVSFNDHAADFFETPSGVTRDNQQSFVTTDDEQPISLTEGLPDARSNPIGTSSSIVVS